MAGLSGEKILVSQILAGLGYDLPRLEWNSSSEEAKWRFARCVAVLFGRD
jgi:hypothetical protein